MESLAALIGESPQLSAIRAQVGRLLERQAGARRLPPFLILGQTGTGKSLLAQALHEASSRAGGPFVSVNCAAIPETLLESELFGFERGAFTDAQRAKPGLFQTADGGALFLDEIGALPLALQAKLLTAIESRTVRRLGGTRAEPVDLWILAATSEDLPVAIRERRFREDLYHRLSAIVFTMPPLRSRGPDVLTLAEHFLGLACRDYGLPPKRLAPDAARALAAYPWPGNVRELANLMERVAVLGDAAVVTAGHLGLPPVGTEARIDPPRPEPGRSLRESLGTVERAELIATLETSRGNLSRAARLLGLTRNTLRYRLAKHGLATGRSPTAPPAAAAARPPAKAISQPEVVERSIAFLWAALEPGASEPGARVLTDALDIVRNKIRAFSGRLEEIDPAGVVASFGLEAGDDPPASAVHAALAMGKALEQSPDPVRLRLKALIHVAACRLLREVDGDVLDGSAKARALSALSELAPSAEADSILVSAAAVPALQPRFTLAPAAGLADPGMARVVTRTPTVAGRPSIAVLPFRNLTADPEQDYFGDGVTEDIIGALSRFRWLFVIARSSTLAYKDRDVSVPQVAAELGVRYLVTGTVRRLGAQLRVTADLIDADAGTTIWAEHYDGALADLFDFQDKIAARIVGSLDARVRGAEIERTLQKRPENFDAYDCVLRALPLTQRFFTPDFFRAEELLERANALDPDFAAAYAWRAWWYLFKVGEGISSDLEADMREANRLAEAALERDPDDSMALAVSGHMYSRLYRDYDRALRRFERALALNPNSAFAWGLSAGAFCYVGEPVVARERALYAMRLSPFDLFGFFFAGLAGLAEMLAGRYEEAIVWGMKARAEKPKYSANLRKLAACLALGGRLDEARTIAQEFLALQTGFTVSEFRQRYPLRDQAALDRYVDGLRMAGLPD